MSLAVFEVYHQFHFEVLERLLRENISMDFCITGVQENFYGDKNIINDLSSRLLENVTTNKSTDFLFPDTILKLNDCPYYLSNDLLEEYASIEMTFLKISDRASAIPLSVHVRRKYYHTILNHFLHIIATHNITHAVCFDTPHSLQGWTLYALLRRNNIRIIRIEHHYFLNYSLILDTPMTPEIEESYLKRASYDEIVNTIPEELLAEFSQANAYVESFIENERRKTATNSFSGHLKLTFQFFFKYFSNIIIGIFPFVYKKHLMHFTSLLNIRTEFKYRMTINKKVRHMYRLHRHYLKISKEPDLSCKYIYFGMHMQPEKTTLPMGRQMDHHLTSINILARSLPEGWKLYVKEHPNQYNLRKVVNGNFRDKLFYKAILDLPNTELVALHVSSREIIAKAQIASTTTGTVGWEALLVGKPAIVFGDAYYRACRGVRTVDDVNSCKKAIQELMSLDSTDIYGEVMRYISFYYNRGYLVKSTNWESKISYSEMERETQVENMAAAIINKLGGKNAGIQ